MKKLFVVVIIVVAGFFIAKDQELIPEDLSTTIEEKATDLWADAKSQASDLWDSIISNDDEVVEETETTEETS